MKREVGVWIDHRKAVIATLAGADETVGPAAAHADSSALDQYYDAVIARIRDADSILIFGPGEARVELKERLDKHLLGGLIVGSEPADKMSGRQIAAKVRRHFQKSDPKL